jgi:hypothetical protein
MSADTTRQRGALSKIQLACVERLLPIELTALRALAALIQGSSNFVCAASVRAVSDMHKLLLLMSLRSDASRCTVMNRSSLHARDTACADAGTQATTCATTSSICIAVAGVTVSSVIVYVTFILVTYLSSERQCDSVLRGRLLLSVSDTKKSCTDTAKFDNRLASAGPPYGAV